MPTTEKQNLAVNEQSKEQPVPAVKPIDSYFTVEHQGMIAAKYRAKYSDNDQNEHKTLWPEFAGNHFTMYVLAETLMEARKAVFSANRQILLNKLIGSVSNYTPTTPDAVLTELQVLSNKLSNAALLELYEQIPDESQRVELLKAFSMTLKKASKTGKDTDIAAAKFAHAAKTFRIVPSTIW